MSKIKVKPTTRKAERKVKLDSVKMKLGQRVYVGSTPDRVKQERDSLRKENVKLKIEVKNK